MNNTFKLFILSLTLCSQSLRAMGSDAAGPANASSRLGVCAICQDEMNRGEDLIAAFLCGHLLHRKCIIDSDEHVRCAHCPICRAQALGEFQPMVDDVPAAAQAPEQDEIVQDEFSGLVRPAEVPQRVWSKVIVSLRETHGQELIVPELSLTSQQLANIISTLPQEIKTRIRVLDASGNQLTELEPLRNLTQLRKLFVSNNQITTVPSTLGLLTQLQELWASNNQFVSLDAILNLNQLQTLDVSHNRLITLTEIGALTQLQKLWAFNNHLIELPKSIGNLTQLKILSVSNNRLTALPDAMGNLANLRVLHVSNNQSTSPEIIQRLANLQTLLIDRSVQLPQLRPEVQVVHE